MDLVKDPHGEGSLTRSTTQCFSNKIDVPSKVLRPTIPTRVKERNRFFGYRIYGLGSIVFVVEGFQFVARTVTGCSSSHRDDRIDPAVGNHVGENRCDRLGYRCNCGKLRVDQLVDAPAVAIRIHVAAQSGNLEYGGYRFIDFLKVGLPLQLLVLAATLIIVPILFPF